MRWVGGRLGIQLENTLVLPLILPQFSLYLEKSSPVWAASPGCGRASYLIAFFSPPSSWKQKELQEQGEIRVIQLGFDLDAHGIVLTEDYRTRVLKACDGRSYAGAVQKFLALVLPACGDLSFQQDQMTQTFGFRDTEITQLVNAGVLTVRDAGSWWLAVPGAGRFVKYFVKGRQAVLGMVRKAKYRELLLSELLGRRAPASVRLGLAYHVHDLIGAQLVDCVSTTSGTLLRLPET
ncbi:Serine/threonine-protein kinase 19 [Myotis davidii]|uniref:Serine/threonine-protein kinase 19 n=1 Tax=Myotis davidii TaxID=225400 RepID=L5LBK2_MYODS|nr:Serine/threonine-protein kinase 19 [Myotis davidii]